MARAPHRGLLKADGITDEEMGRPLVAVFNSRNDIVPGHNDLDKIAEAVKAGIYLAGGVPFEISTIGVCDGIAMNHDGMHYSLVSREVIADSLECAVQGHAFDALVCIPNCDKIVPGMLLGALRVNIPTVFVSGGPMLAGTRPGGCGPATDLNTLFDGAAAVMNGTMTEDELKYHEDHACPTCGSCSGHLHGELDELPLRGPRHRAARQRHHPGRVLRAHPPGEACGHEGDGAAGARHHGPRHRERGCHPQRHGMRHGLRRLHEHGAPPHGHRTRGRPSPSRWTTGMPPPPVPRTS